MGLLDSVIGSVTGDKTSPLTKALLVMLAAKLATSYFGQKSSETAPAGSGTLPAPSTPPSDKIETGILAGLPSLGSILGHFRSSGHDDKVDSWVGSGPNKPIEAKDLEATLGPDAVSQLQQVSGLPKDELLKQLSQMLPQVIDKLTPGGKIPTDRELHG